MLVSHLFQIEAQYACDHLQRQHQHRTWILVPVHTRHACCHYKCGQVFGFDHVCAQDAEYCTNVVLRQGEECDEKEHFLYFFSLYMISKLFKDCSLFRMGLEVPLIWLSSIFSIILLILVGVDLAIDLSRSAKDSNNEANKDLLYKDSSPCLLVGCYIALFIVQVFSTHYVVDPGVEDGILVLHILSWLFWAVGAGLYIYELVAINNCKEKRIKNQKCVT